MVEYGRDLEWLQLQEDLQKAEFPMLGFQAGDVQFQLWRSYEFVYQGSFSEILFVTLWYTDLL